MVNLVVFCYFTSKTDDFTKLIAISLKSSQLLEINSKGIEFKYVHYTAMAKHFFILNIDASLIKGQGCQLYLKLKSIWRKFAVAIVLGKEINEAFVL